MSDVDESDSREEAGPDPSATGAADAGPREAPRDAGDELRSAFSSLKNAAGLLFGSVQPALREAMDEAEKVVQKARESAKPAVEAAAEEASRVVRQVGETTEPLARNLGSELHKLTEAMADAVEGAVRGTRGATRRGGAPTSNAEDADADGAGNDGDR